MKKIYTLVACLVLGGSIIGQNAVTPPVHPKQKADLSKVKLPVTGIRDQSKSTFDAWVEPVGDVMTQLGTTLTGASTGNSQGNFINPMFQDSTVTSSDATNGTTSMFTIMLGSVLDPKSQFLQSSLTPYVTATQPYYLDSLGILASYVKVTPAVDTLYTWIVWGDTSNTSTVFKKLKTSTSFNAPLNAWRYEVIGPKVTGAAAGPGNVMKSSVPSTNMLLIKYVLQSTDSSSVSSAGVGIKLINIPIPTISIPGGNIVSCYYEFVPGGAYTANACSFAFSGAPATQTINGFAGCIWQQTSPAVSSLASFTNEQIDPDGWNMGTSYNSYQRHLAYGATSGWNTVVPGDQITAANVYYKISSTPEGVAEINNDFMLLQNQPNPFTNETTIKYHLNKTASEVAVQIYDVRGVKMYEKTDKNLKPGNYSLNINDINFAPGVYFCTLVVDGAKVTNKIIKQ